jgi:serine/threonine protein kinase
MLQTFIKHYKILSELGRGGMAVVYLAHDSKFDTNVAVKLLNKEYVHNDNIRKRFLAEARNMYRMSHPNIIKVTDLIDEDDNVAFVMEYIEGETLKEYLERKGKLKDDEIKSIFTQMLDAVGYVHEQKLVHRDIKPSNFMVAPSGKVKLMDFGIAKNTDTSSAEHTQTGTGVQMGTPMYMSPEQVKSSKEVGPASDIYSLGVVLWQMVSGRKPYNSNTLSTVEIHIKILQESLEPTGAFWDNVIFKALEKEPSSRFSNAIRFKNALEPIEVNSNDKTILEEKIKQAPIPAPRLSQANKPPINSKIQKTTSNNYLKAGLIFLFLAVFFCLFYLSNNRRAIDDEIIVAEDSVKTEDSLLKNKFLRVVGKNTNGDFKYGFIDANGNWVIQPKFDYVNDFNNGLARAYNGKYGFIDSKGNWVIQPKFDCVNDFINGLAKAQLNEKCGFIDTLGNWVIQPKFSSLRNFNEGLAVAELNNKYGFIDTMGNWVIQPKFSSLRDFNEGLAVVRLNDKWGYINTKGDWVFRFNDQVFEFTNGLAAAYFNGKYGYINITGNWVIQPIFDWFGDEKFNGNKFSNGLARAQSNKKYGFIDTSGNWVIQPVFSWAGDFNNGLARAQLNEKFGFIDTKGNWVIQPKFSNLENFNEGLARVAYNGKIGFIDTQGNWVIKPVFIDDESAEAYCWKIF